MKPEKWERYYHEVCEGRAGCYWVSDIRLAESKEVIVRGIYQHWDEVDALIEAHNKVVDEMANVR